MDGGRAEVYGNSVGNEWMVKESIFEESEMSIMREGSVDETETDKKRM